MKNAASSSLSWPGQAAIETGGLRKPYILYKPDGSTVGIQHIPITVRGLNAVGKEMNSFSALLDAFYAERDAAERMKQRARVFSTAAHQRQRPHTAHASSNISVKNFGAFRQAGQKRGTRI